MEVIREEIYHIYLPDKLTYINYSIYMSE